MMAITWQALDAPRLTESAQMMNQSANNLANAFSGLNKAFDPIRQARAVQLQEDRNAIVDSLTGALNNAQTLEATEALKRQYLDPSNLQRFGVDLSAENIQAIRSAAERAPQDFMERTKLNNDFVVSQQQAADRPVSQSLLELIQSAKDLTQLESLRANITEQAKGMNDGQKVLAAFNDRVAAFNTDATRREEQQRARTLFGQTQEDRTKTKAEEATFKELTNYINDGYLRGNNETTITEIIADDLRFKNLPPAMQEELLAFATKQGSENSSLLSGEDRRLLATKQATNKAQAESDIKAVNDKFALFERGLSEAQANSKSPIYTGTTDIIKLAGNDIKGKFDPKDIARMNSDISKGVTQAKIAVASKFWEEGTKAAKLADLEAAGLITPKMRESLQKITDKETFISTLTPLIQFNENEVVNFAKENFDPATFGWVFDDSIDIANEKIQKFADSWASNRKLLAIGEKVRMEKDAELVQKTKDAIAAKEATDKELYNSLRSSRRNQ